MADQQEDTSVKLPDPVELSQSMTRIAEQSHRIVTEFLTRQGQDPQLGMADPLNIGSAFLEMTQRMMSDPAKLMAAQMGLWQDYMRLWQSTTLRMLGHEDDQPVVEPHHEDRRFKHEAWSDCQSRM